MHTRFRHLLGIGMACLALASVEVQADIVYKWLDDQGGVHLSAQPPVGREYEKIAVSTGHSAPPAKSADASETEAKPAPSAVQANPAIKKDPKICKSAKSNLETLSLGGQIRLKDEYGGERILSEEEVAQQKKRAQDVIKQHCD